MIGQVKNSLKDLTDLMINDYGWSMFNIQVYVLTFESGKIHVPDEILLVSLSYQCNSALYHRAGRSWGCRRT